MVRLSHLKNTHCRRSNQTARNVYRYVHSFTAYQITNYWLVSGNVASAYSGLTLPNQSPNLIVTPERGGLFSDRYPSAFVPSAYTTGVITATVVNTLRKLSAFAYSLFNRIENTQTMQKDELNAKVEPSEYLEVPWIVCKIPSRP